MVICGLCLQKRLDLKKMYRHSMSRHSKAQIVGELLRSSLLLGLGNRSRPQRKPPVFEKRKSNADTFLTSNSLEITMENQEIILTDCKHKVQYNVPLKYGRRRSWSADNAETLRSCHFVITRLPKQAKQPGQQINDFYICSCKKNPTKEKKKKLTPVTSDTESCSDSEPKVSCIKCGNGYRTQDALVDHLYHHLQVTDDAIKQSTVNKVRIYACPICREQFTSEVMLFEHIQWHNTKDRVLEDVLDMEEEYMRSFNEVPNINRGANMNDILNFLTDTNI